LAALLDYINEHKTCHIITIEDPIEFLHNHKRSIVHQRELHSDTPTVSAAMRAALRQAPNIIAVGELKDQESVELALEAAETGHVVLSTLNAAHAQQAIDRLLAGFPHALVGSIEERLAGLVRYIICQRLIPQQSDGGRKAIFEVLEGGSLARLFQGENPGAPRDEIPADRKS
jgi:twitching motility protein PilT